MISIINTIIQKIFKNFNKLENKNEKIIKAKSYLKKKI